MLAATLVAPGRRHGRAAGAEFMASRTAPREQDYERNAAEALATAYGARGGVAPVYLGDDLFACQPICEAALANGADFLFTAKRDSTSFV